MLLTGLVVLVFVVVRVASGASGAINLHKQRKATLPARPTDRPPACLRQASYPGSEPFQPFVGQNSSSNGSDIVTHIGFLLHRTALARSSSKRDTRPLGFRFEFAAGLSVRLDRKLKKRVRCGLPVRKRERYDCRKRRVTRNARFRNPDRGQPERFQVLAKAFCQ